MQLLLHVDAEKGSKHEALFLCLKASPATEVNSK